MSYTLKDFLGWEESSDSSAPFTGYFAKVGEKSNEKGVKYSPVYYTLHPDQLLSQSPRAVQIMASIILRAENKRSYRY